MKKLIGQTFHFGILFLAIASDYSVAAQKSDKTQYVNTFIGTGGHGHTFPGATTPYGMVQLSPDTRTIGWDACGGYHYTDTSIIGFSHTHLSGTGISDLGDILFMPYSGTPKTIAGTAENPELGYRSTFSHTNESAAPGYYTVHLDEENVDVALTATTRAGFHKYSYKNGGKSGIIIDLSHTIYPDKKPDHQIRIISATEIQGYKKSSGWAEDQSVFFQAKFNKPFRYTFYENGKKLEAKNSAQSKNLQLVLEFDLQKGEEILAKVGISSVDNLGAKQNLEKEIPAWNFDAVKKAAHQLWEDELNKINIKGGSKNEKTIFYTSLYHTAISPNVFNDIDYRYRGMDKKIKNSNGKNSYTVFSLWDTFRSYNPLKTITDPERTTDFINTLLAKYDEGGVLPMWELEANYTGCMIGYHSVPVIVDAYKKGIRDFDVEKAFKAMKESATFNREGILFPSEDVANRLMPKAKLHNETMGFIPSDLERQSVSKALEYAYDDWCIAQMAKDLGKTDDYQVYRNRSKKYTQYYDTKTGFMRGKNQDGTWREPFDPRFSQHNVNDYTEGNAYQWTWFVPQDVEGLVKLMGGKNAFITNLDNLFSTSSELTGGVVSEDITGLIGQYAHGNEPSHHITHLYNFVGEAWKTQNLTNQIMSTLYFNNPNGLAGNEDCGQMSAWYVLNAMGFYSFCPGDNQYSIGRPLFDETTIQLSNKKTFTIRTKNNSAKNKYIQSVKLNGISLKTPFFSHQDILNGSILEFEMGDKINKQVFTN